MNPLTIALTFLGIYLFIILAASIGIYRECRRKLKQIEHAHQTEQETLLDVNAVNWEELGFELGERPFIKLR